MTLTLGSRPKQRFTKVQAENETKMTFHAPRTIGRCEAMNSHIPKWAPTLKTGIPMDFQLFIKQLQGSKLIRLKSSLCHWKALET
jgi:hypothetical protein